MTDDTHPPAWQLWIAFAALYIIWGSTYLSIKIAIETMPPFLMATTRFLLAGAILYAYARLKGEAQNIGYTRASSAASSSLEATESSPYPSNGSTPAWPP